MTLVSLLPEPAMALSFRLRAPSPGTRPGLGFWALGHPSLHPLGWVSNKRQSLMWNANHSGNEAGEESS